MRMREFSFLGFAICVALLFLTPAFPDAEVPSHASRETLSYDVVIRGGRVVDPESGLDAVRNVGISDGIIRKVSAEPLKGRATIDATGLVVSSGFIDLDAYPQNARFSLQDGVTTALDLRGGTADVDRWYAEREGRMLINLGVSVGYTRVREEVMGEAGSLRREKLKQASEGELAEILHRIQSGLDHGAVAVGLGPSELLGPPSWELVETFRTAARARAHVVATLRDAIWSTTDVPANLSEMIGAAAMSGAAIHIPHVSSSGGPHTPRMLAMIAGARKRGLDITAEDYPYTAAIIRVPPGALNDWSDEELREVQWISTGERLTRESYKRYRDQEAFAIIHNSSIEPFVAQAIASPLTSIASHGSVDAQGRGHPRTSGTYSRVLGRYVREQKAVSLMEALRKMTLMPARRLEARAPSMRKKGRIRKGADADITVFDPDRIIDAATYQEPTRPSQGIRYVLVNGVMLLKDGVLQDGVHPGRAVRAPVSPAK
jgi:N-acyl-D-aspartate/D-glutamate deacylase